MIDLTRFSSLYPELGSLFPRPGALPSQERPRGAASGLVDRLDLQRLANANGASFDRMLGPIRLGADGTYQPLLGRTSATPFNFRLNLRENPEIAAPAPEAAVEEPAEEATPSPDAAMEAASQSYQAALTEAERGLAAGLSESRRLQTDLFYSRTRELTLTMDSARAEQFEGTSRRVARTFELSIRLEFTFLSQFTSQSEDISSLDDALFGRYLENTDGLSARSAEAVQAFFDEVGRILDATEAATLDSLASYFDDVAATFELSEDLTAQLMGMVAGEITSFFQEVDAFLTEARGGLSGWTAPQASLPEPEAEAEAPLDLAA